MKKLIQSLVYWIEKKLFLSMFFRYDEKEGAIKSKQLMGRYAVMPSEFLYMLTDEYKKAAGRGSSAVLYRMGFENGKGLGTVLADQYEYKSTKKWAKIVARIVRTAGWVPLLDYKAYGAEELPKIRLMLWDYVLSMYLKEGDESYCDWGRGWVAGVFSGVLNEDLMCMETQCKADGNPYCEWLVGRREDVIFEGI